MASQLGADAQRVRSQRIVNAVDVTTTFKVDREILEGVIINGIEGGRFGISYWSPKQRLRIPSQGFDPATDVVKSEQRADEVWDSYIARNVLDGGTLTFYEMEDESGPEENWKERTLTRENLIAAIGRFLLEFAPESAKGNYEKDSGLTDFDWDGPDSDVILQLALLGEVVYG